MRALLCALLLARAAADECTFAHEYYADVDEEYFRWTDPPKRPYLWAGLKCEELRCDEATGALWLRVQHKKLGQTFRHPSHRGHRKFDRSYCMARARAR